MILLINPPETEMQGYTTPPLGLMYLAGTLIAHGHSVEIVDGCLDGMAWVEARLRATQPGIVGITCMTPGRKKALQVARLARDILPDALIVMGGPHPTIAWAPMLENYSYIDVCVLGEGERTFAEIADGKPLTEIAGIAIRHRGKVVRTPRRPPASPDALTPAWDLVNLRRYPPMGRGVKNGVDIGREPRIPVAFSRGCVGHCSFCSTWWIWQCWRHRTPKNMADELQMLTEKGYSHFCFVDDCMTVDREAAGALCDEIVARGLKIAFHATTRADCVDEPLLDKMKAAGCYGISYGIETASPSLLETMGKDTSIESAALAIMLTKHAGIEATALLIVGAEGETEQTVQETVRFLRGCEPDVVGSVGGLWILPGTALYTRCKAKGYIDDGFWLGDEPYKLYELEHDRARLDAWARRLVNYSWKARMKTWMRRFI